MNYFSSHKLHWHRLIFILFLLSIPLSIRKFVTVFSADGLFNEYLDVSLYLSDILLVVTLIFYVLCNKYELLSIKYWRRMFHVEHLLLPLFVPTFFVIWSGMSIFWSKSQELALYTFIHIVSGYLLYVYIILSNVPRGTNDWHRECSTWNKREDYTEEMFHVEQMNENGNVPRGTFPSVLIDFMNKCSTWNIYRIILVAFIFSGTLESFLALFQFILQKSLGLSLFKESLLSVSLPGISKVAIGDNFFLRSYGLFPHPNVLGGFLAISLLMTIFYPLIFKTKMFHVEHSDNVQNVPRGTFFLYLRSLIRKCSTWNKIQGMYSEMFHVEHFRGMYPYRVILFVQLLALLLTFSKTAIAGFFFGLVMAIIYINRMFHVEHSNNNDNVPRGTSEESGLDVIDKCSTWNKLQDTYKKMFHVEHLFIVFGMILSFFIIIIFNLKFFVEQPFIERLFYMRPLRVLSERYLFEGLGIGQFVYRMQDFFDENLLNWQFQPIHNVYLLIFGETGIVGLALFLWFLLFTYLKNGENVPRGTFSELKQKDNSKCSTWNKLEAHALEMFHVEQFVSNTKNQFSGENEEMKALLMQSILLVLFLSMFFDHYLWDIQQGQLVLWILLALAVSGKNVDK